jgi:nucleotide-binding universal stress UspA family protein
VVEGFDMQIRKLLVPIDDSDLSSKVLDAALTLAERFGAHVHVLYVRHETRPQTIDEQARDEEEFETEFRAVRDTALFKLQERGQRLPEDHVHAEVRTGAPLDCILEASDDIRPDIIVMGTHGQQNIADRFVGTTTERVLLRARPALLVIRDDPPEVG